MNSKEENTVVDIQRKRWSNREFSELERIFLVFGNLFKIVVI